MCLLIPEKQLSSDDLAYLASQTPANRSSFEEADPELTIQHSFEPSFVDNPICMSQIVASAEACGLAGAEW